LPWKCSGSARALGPLLAVRPAGARSAEPAAGGGRHSRRRRSACAKCNRSSSLIKACRPPRTDGQVASDPLRRRLRVSTGRSQSRHLAFLCRGCVAFRRVGHALTHRASEPKCRREGEQERTRTSWWPRQPHESEPRAREAGISSAAGQLGRQSTCGARPRETRARGGGPGPPQAQGEAPAPCSREPLDALDGLCEATSSPVARHSSLPAACPAPVPSCSACIADVYSTR